jgi:hypothetical protein
MQEMLKKWPSYVPNLQKGIEMTEEEITNFRVKVEKHMNKYTDNSYAHMMWADLDDALETLLYFINASSGRKS